MSSSTPSRRPKYATEEERKAAARERQRLYAARKRAEAKEAKLRADSQPTDGDEPAAVQFVEFSPPVKRTPKKAPVEALVTPRKRATRSGDGGSTITNGNRGYRELAGEQQQPPRHQEEEEGDQERKWDAPAPTSEAYIAPPSFSQRLTASDFLPPAHAHADYILIPPLPSPSAQLHPSPPDEYAFVFIPGNPGLISYYTTYLASLSQHLSDSALPSARFTIFGASLAGFNTGPSPAPASPTGHHPLEAQVTRQTEILVHLLGAHPTLKVILAGHSLGAYLLLESLHRLSLDPAHNQLKQRIVGGIGVFPALTHLARSSSGRVVGPLVAIPGFLPLAILFANLLAFIVPTALLTLLIGLANPHFEADARQATAAFLKSPRGIRQALRLGGDELRDIREDAWGDAVWGSEALAGRGRTELIFYFGEKDHWVADEEREALITGRGRGGMRWREDGVLMTEGKEKWKPRMVVCEEGVPHSFCVAGRHSELMADKTAAWVEEIAANERGA